MTKQKFQMQIRNWYRRHGRHGLPWRKTRDPYKILVSEVMLQQTQVSRVVPKYREFLASFPTIFALHRAPLSGVLRVWQGMGYNRRALYLKRLAHIIMAEHGGLPVRQAGRIPSDPEMLRCLPGIGRATAGAVAAFAFGRRTPFLETNIRRVHLHWFFPDRRRVSDAEILKKVEATLPARNIREWYWALMDYGAMGLKGIENPNRRSALGRRQPRFSGSVREARGKILAALLQSGHVAAGELQGEIPSRTFATALEGLRSDGLLVQRQSSEVRLP